MTTRDLRQQINLTVSNGFTNILFSESRGCVRIHPPGSANQQLDGPTLLPIYQGRAIPQKRCSSFVSGSRAGPENQMDRWLWNFLT